MNLEKIVLDLKKSDPKLFDKFYEFLESAANHVSETTADPPPETRIVQ